MQLSSGQEVALYSRSYALVVEVQSYRHWDRLINPIRDARDVGEAQNTWEGMRFLELSSPTQGITHRNRRSPETPATTPVKPGDWFQ